MVDSAKKNIRFCVAESKKNKKILAKVFASFCFYKKKSPPTLQNFNPSSEVDSQNLNKSVIARFCENGAKDMFAKVAKQFGCKYLPLDKKHFAYYKVPILWQIYSIYPLLKSAERKFRRWRKGVFCTNPTFRASSAI